MEEYIVKELIDYWALLEPSESKRLKLDECKTEESLLQMLRLHIAIHERHIFQAKRCKNFELLRVYQKTNNQLSCPLYFFDSYGNILDSNCVSALEPIEIQCVYHFKHEEDWHIANKENTLSYKSEKTEMRGLWCSLTDPETSHYGRRGIKLPAHMYSFQYTFSIKYKYEYAHFYIPMVSNEPKQTVLVQANLKRADGYDTHNVFLPGDVAFPETPVFLVRPHDMCVREKRTRLLCKELQRNAVPSCVPLTAKGQQPLRVGGETGFGNYVKALDVEEPFTLTIKGKDEAVTNVPNAELTVDTENSRLACKQGPVSLISPEVEAGGVPTKREGCGELPLHLPKRAKQVLVA